MVSTLLSERSNQISFVSSLALLHSTALQCVQRLMRPKLTCEARGNLGVPFFRGLLKRVHFLLACFKTNQTGSTKWTQDLSKHRRFIRGASPVGQDFTLVLVFLWGDPAAQINPPDQSGLNIPIGVRTVPQFPGTFLLTTGDSFAGPGVSLVRAQGS